MLTRIQSTKINADPDPQHWLGGVASSVADPDPGYCAFLTPGSGMDKKKSRSGSGSTSERLETICVKILYFFDAYPDPGSFF
jgi:hypothetical protein